jgi:RNase P/RNase MRP subunit p30
MEDLVLNDEEEIVLLNKKLGNTSVKVEVLKEIKQIRNQKPIIILAHSEGIIKAAAENRRVNILLDPHNNQNQDYMHSRNSGLDQAICGLMKKHKIAMGISFASIVNTKNRPLILGKLSQNLRLCKKYNIPIILASFATKKEELVSESNFKALIRSLEQ